MHPILLLLLLVGIVFGVKYVRRLPPAQRPKVLLIAGACLLLLLAMMGKLNPLVAALAGLVAAGTRVMGLVQTFSGLQGIGQKFKSATSGQSQGQSSTVRTDWLAMALDHDTGAMRGEVLRGRFAGASLESLDQASLMALHAELSSVDGRSLALLEAWLDRELDASWRQHAHANASGNTVTEPTGSMTLAEAREILGLGSNANAEDVVAAHRRLMQKLHPDRGGSDFLASQVNRAKDVLLKSA